MKKGIPSYGNPEGRVYGLNGELFSSEDGKVYRKSYGDSMNYGWAEMIGDVPTEVVTPTVTPTPTP